MFLACQAPTTGLNLSLPAPAETDNHRQGAPEDAAFQNSPECQLKELETGWYENQFNKNQHIMKGLKEALTS